MICELRKLFIDEELKMIFDARIEYYETGDKWSFINRMVEMKKVLYMWGDIFENDCLL